MKFSLVRSIPRTRAGLVLVALLALAQACTSKTEGTTDLPVTNAGSMSVAGFGGAGGAGMGGAGSVAIAGAGGMAGIAGTTAIAGTSAGGSAGMAGSMMMESGAGGASGTAGSSDDGGMGGSAGSGESGTDGGDAFNPCPDTGPCKVLPFGDSITFGIGSTDRGGYRSPLFELAVTDSKDITFVGSQNTGPSMVGGMPFPSNHEGYSGWTISGIDGLIPDPAFEEIPHIVLLHIGTNDMYMQPAGAPERLDELIGNIVEVAPDALVVVAQIIPFTGVDAFNAEIPDIVEAHAGMGEHVIMVDQHTDFPNSELGDGVHPNDAGYERMAAVWYAAIKDMLPAK